MRNLSLPEFQTSRLFLRGVQLSDWSSYQKNFADYAVIRHLSHLVPWPYPESGVQEFLENVILPEQGIRRWTWAIFLKEDKAEVIGVVDLWKNGCPENRGFWLARSHWGKGLMTEAVTPVMDYSFKELGFEKLTFANAVGNERSRRVKEKTGARFIETRPARFVDPQYTEHEIWELTKEDWLASNRLS
jgi:ribosomal-protein-alanine N-acetyltransferase